MRDAYTYRQWLYFRFFYFPDVSRNAGGDKQNDIPILQMGYINSSMWRFCSSPLVFDTNQMFETFRMSRWFEKCDFDVRQG